ncbi:hypothetical protein OG436_29345 [Streptomyces caniferus]|uniref:hypothetical protein n=1 Tax=Streptomyces caniferus TaxID=285557 RepID=UPI002E2B2A2D|nr:hypothetical protein [Streptomyces caniferus]
MPEEITPPAPPAVNEHGFPDNTPTAEMSPEHQVAYWKHHARKHEQRANGAPDAAELERLRAAEAELNTRKQADMTESQRLQAAADAAQAAANAAEAKAAEATAQLLRVQVATEKSLTPAQATWLQGATKEELEASAAKLLADFAPAGSGEGAQGGSAHRSGGARGSDVGGGASSIETGAELYKQRHSKN